MGYSVTSQWMNIRELKKQLAELTKKELINEILKRAYPNDYI